MSKLNPFYGQTCELNKICQVIVETAKSVSPSFLLTEARTSGGDREAFVEDGPVAAHGQKELNGEELKNKWFHSFKF